MGDRRLSGSRFWLLGAAYWIVIAALIGVAVQLWPQLQSPPHVAAIVICAVVGGLAIVYLFQPKS